MRLEIILVALCFEDTFMPLAMLIQWSLGL